MPIQLSFDRPRFAILHSHNADAADRARGRYSYLNSASQDVLPPLLIPHRLPKDDTESWLAELIENNDIDALIIIWDKEIQPSSAFEQALVELSKQELSTLILWDPLDSWQPPPTISKRFQPLSTPDDVDEAAFLRGLFRLMQRRAGRIGRDFAKSKGRLGNLYFLYSKLTFISGSLLTLVCLGVGATCWLFLDRINLQNQLAIEHQVVQILGTHIESTTKLNTPRPNQGCKVLDTHLKTLERVVEMRRSRLTVDEPHARTNVTLLAHKSDERGCRYLEPALRSDHSEATIKRFYFDPACVASGHAGPGVGNCAYRDRSGVVSRYDIEPGSTHCSWVESKTSLPGEDEQDVACIYVGPDIPPDEFPAASGVLCMATSGLAPFSPQDRILLGQVANVFSTLVGASPSTASCKQ